MERVVVTGLGFVSCLGHSPDEVAASLREGRSGIIRDPERIELGFRSALTGQIQNFDPTSRLKRKERRSMGEPALYAAVAALRAIEDQGRPLEVRRCVHDHRCRGVHPAVHRERIHSDLAAFHPQRGVRVDRTR